MLKLTYILEARVLNLKVVEDDQEFLIIMIIIRRRRAGRRKNAVGRFLDHPSTKERGAS